MQAMVPYYFPEEILLEILYKLPVKSVGKCMCVCKAWNFLIKTPSFVSSHASKYSTGNNTNLFLFRTSDVHESNSRVEYSLLFDDREFSKYDQLLQTPFDFTHSIVGSCNGLLCLELVGNGLSFQNQFILWNPIIKRCFRVPKPWFCTLPNKILSGFGFDSRRDDYKILKIAKYDLLYKYVVQVELYSLKTNSWKILVSPILHLYTEDKFMAFANGVVHWVAFERVNDQWHSKYKFLLMGFHMGHEVFIEIMLPQSLSNLHYQKSETSMYVIPYHELSSIALIESVYDKCNIWVMKKYNVVETWTKMYNLVACGMGQVPRALVLGFRKNGGLILDDGFTQRADLHDMEGNQVNYFLGICGYSYVLSYAESLVLLDQVIDSTSENGAKNLSNSIEGITDNFTRLAIDGSSDARD
ncbi:hypothetical protein PTKIN_Ptkin14bG0106100 [Pterospermum kingtungense]